MKDLRPTEGEAAAREAIKAPFPLCHDCAVLYTAAFPLEQRPGERKTVCANCHKKRLCAEYAAPALHRSGEGGRRDEVER